MWVTPGAAKPHVLAVFPGHGQVIYFDVFGLSTVASSLFLPGSDWFLSNDFPLNRPGCDIASDKSGSGSVSEEDLDLRYQ